MNNFIDVSSAQGFIHWHILADQANPVLNGVVLKACDGMLEDQAGGGIYSYTENRIKADRYKFPVLGVYGWWYPNRNDQTTGQMARALFRLASGARKILDLELRTWMIWQASWKTDIQNHLDALDQLAGIPTIAYMGLTMMYNLMNLDHTWPTWLTQRPLWLPEYPARLANAQFDQWNLSNYKFRAPTGIPSTWPTPVWAWQFNANGVLAGVPGNSTDLNVVINPL